MEDVLRDLTRDIPSKSVNISVSGQQAIIRYIDFPKMKPEELRQALKFEAQKHIPFPVSEVSIDGCILRDDLPDNKMKVLLAAVKKDLIEQRLKLLSAAGLSVNVIEIDSISLVNAFNYNYADDDMVKNKTVALLNIGSATSNLNILENGLLAMSRDIAIGGNNLTQRIADSAGVDFKAAEALKTGKDKKLATSAIAAIEPVFAKLAQEVRTSFDYHESRSVSSVERIFISGGASLYLGINELFGTYLGLDVTSWDPLRKLKVASTVDQEKLKTVSGQLAVAIGLGLRK
jgi:type IV pilus assembly protein PilM